MQYMERLGIVTFLCYITLAACWQTNHHDADLGILSLDASAISAWCHACQFSAEGLDWLVCGPQETMQLGGNKKQLGKTGL